MDLTEMLVNLMLDLNMTLDDEISVTEATRCINRAVDDMSRHLPRERIYEHTWIEAVTDDSFVAPAAQSDTSIIAGLSIKDETDGGTLSIDNLFTDIPRPLKVTLTDANNSISRMTLVIKGIDGDGIYREERFYRQDGKVQTGKVHFSMVSQVQLGEIAGNGDGDTISIGYGIITGIWIQLANPIKPGSESIYSDSSKSGTKYTLGTDYEMDYANGKISLKSSGSMTAGTTYWANYNKAQLGIDISGIIPELIRVTKVIYPVDKIPEQSVAFSIWENILTLGSPRPGVSQEAMLDKEHIAIYYEARHAPPTEVGSGSYPNVLDQVVLIGAAGYALLSEAIQYELQAAIDLAEVRTTLGYLGVGGTSKTFEHALADVALDKAAILLMAGATGKIDVALDKAAVILTASTGEIDIALDKAAVLLTASSGKIDVALTKVAQYLETHDTGASGVDNAKKKLEAVLDDVAVLRNAVREAGTPMTGALAEADIALGETSSIDLDASTVGATAWLLEGELLIDKLTDGENVAAHFADYARTKVQIAQARVQVAVAYAQSAQITLGNLRSYIEEAGGWTRMGETFIAEAQTLLGQVNACIGEASARVATVNACVSEASARIATVDGCIGEANARIATMDRLLAEAAQYQTTAEANMVLADRFRAEGQIRLNEFNTVLSSKAEYRKRIVSVPVRQPA